ncbi:hypothetical protein GMA12_11415 [Kocuria sediminis]|uniref:Uncharacterized protein n=1 Tax=Kocuria sediminis TaxID=1038857 RepID=A0A6N8GR40_9MICC|nr:hypothetical protein [Kocuria sediminis]MUN63743.1 hypothetical protein [Kocuria sediminis]
MSTIDLTDAAVAAARAEHERAAHPESPSWELCTALERTAHRIAVLPIPVHSRGTGSR